MNCNPLSNLIRQLALPVLSIAVLLAVTIFLSHRIDAQSVNSSQVSDQTASTSQNFRRNAPAIAEALEPLVKQHSASVVQITGDDGHTQLGTIVTSDGLIVAKYSELPTKILCRLHDDKAHVGKLIGTDTRHDLALIQINATELNPVSLDLKAPEAGTLVVSGGPKVKTPSKEKAPCLGIVTVTPQSFKLQQLPRENSVELGALISGSVQFEFGPAPNHSTLQQIASGLKIKRVAPRTAAEDCGLLVGDLLHAFNGTELNNRQQLLKILKTFKSGQSVELQVIREGKVLELTTQLKPSSRRTTHDLWGGGPFSNRRFGFDTVIAHDGIIDPQHCGGPLVDLQGRVVGINIARSMRSATFAIPAKDVQEFIRFVKPDAKIEFDNR